MQMFPCCVRDEAFNIPAPMRFALGLATVAVGVIVADAVFCTAFVHEPEAA
jgi:hypothetical protein